MELRLACILKVRHFLHAYSQERQQTQNKYQAISTSHNSNFVVKYSIFYKWPFHQCTRKELTEGRDQIIEQLDFQNSEYLVKSTHTLSKLLRKKTGRVWNANRANFTAFYR